LESGGAGKTMKLGIMQPYFLPYIGYWQLIKSVDVFVIYDNIQYTKKGWFNRNRYLLNGKDALFSINLKNDNDFLNVNERFISPEYKRAKLISMFQNAYSKAPMKNEILPFLSEIINCQEENLFKYIYNSVIKMCGHLEVNTEIVISSSLDIDHSLKAENKVLAICKKLGAETYINAIGGMELYSKEMFKEQGIELKFIKSKPIEYRQFNNEFVPWLSILDLLMFNDKERVKDFLEEYELV
jgi:hypothetical protein